jgi:hypothetical protein
MRFRRYCRGSIVAHSFDDLGALDLRHADGRSLLLTRDGIPRSVIEKADLADVVAILGCVVADLDREACAARGVEVVS